MEIADSSLPSGWRTVALTDLLDISVRKDIRKVMETHTGPSDEIVKKFKALLAPHAEDLEKKGVLADYLAYYLAHVFQQMNHHAKTK